ERLCPDLPCRAEGAVPAAGERLRLLPIGQPHHLCAGAAHQRPRTGDRRDRGRLRAGGDHHRAVRAGRPRRPRRGLHPAVRGTTELLDDTLADAGVRCTLVDPWDLDAWEAAFTDDTRAAIVESIANPGAQLVDLPAL